MKAYLEVPYNILAKEVLGCIAVAYLLKVLCSIFACMRCKVLVLTFQPVWQKKSPMLSDSLSICVNAKVSGDFH